MLFPVHVIFHSPHGNVLSAQALLVARTGPPIRKFEVLQKCLGGSKPALPMPSGRLSSHALTNRRRRTLPQRLKLSGMTELPPTLVGLQQALERRELSHDEAIAAQRQRLERLDSRFHAVVQMLPAPASRSNKGRLAGVGLAHKDIFNTLGRKPGAGHDRGSASPGLRPAPAIARLAAHGASDLAALSMAPYACGATGDNSRFRRCVNPLRAEAVVGGSSSGSAVAVAAQMAYGSLGTDTAGSVRIPAATCGVLGLKITHGLIATDGVYPLAPSLDSVGLLTRSAADAMQILQAVAGSDQPRPLALASARVKAWIPDADLHDSVARALEAFADACQAVTRIRQWKGHNALTQLAEIVLHVESARIHRQALLDAGCAPAVEAVALGGLVIPRQWHDAALADRARRTREFVAQHLLEHDVFMAPALPDPIPDWTDVTPGHAAFNARRLLGLHRYMSFVNYLGLPSLVMPVAKDARGMPISVQLVARPFHENLLLGFAHRLELRLFGEYGLTQQFFPKN